MVRLLKRAVLLLILLQTFYCHAQKSIYSPNEELQVELFLNEGEAFYRVYFQGDTVMEDSPLGLKTNLVNFSSGFSEENVTYESIDQRYTQKKIKRSSVHYVANEIQWTLKNEEDRLFIVTFRVSNNDIAFRYEIPAGKDPLALVVEEELTGFNFPAQSKSYLTPQSPTMVGWKRSKPSYEERYVAEQEITASSTFKEGYTFPGLFTTGSKWLLLSETGVRGLYCGSHLSDPTDEGLYSIAFPNPTENNGFGSTGAAIGLPATTPWRTITVGEDLKPIVETTISYDVVEPLYEPSIDYEYGKGTWSWIMWQDASMNYEDQVTYIDFASTLGFSFILIDAMWDVEIGYPRMEELIDYAHSKNVDVFLWYNSNGAANDAPQTPRHKMNTAIERKAEMKWLKEQGVKGIKVDFLAGDKQETIRLYEDILSDANDYGLMVDFHGATLPRGWERMFPNFVGSEAVLASENLMFSQGFNDIEAFNATMLPFIRNAVASMEYGGVVLNERYNRTNDGGNVRKTTDAFQLAIAVLYQNPVQFFALAPNNLKDAPDWAVNFVKNVPTLWDDIVFIDGLPGEFCILARQHQDTWYVAGVNAREEPLEKQLNFPMLAGKEVTIYNDRADGTSFHEKIRVKKNGNLNLTIQPNGGFVLKTE